MKQGERQVAPTRIGIRRDHVARYAWAAERIKPGSTVADLACGVGYGTQLLAQHGMKVLGVDKEADAIAYAKRHYTHPNARYITSPCVLGMLDAAVCFETIEHVADPLPLLKALRAAPLLLASVPNETAYPFKGHAFHFRHYTRAEFEELLNRAGWEVTEWWGQTGKESEVVRGNTGRTIIAVCKRSTKRAPKNTSVPKAGESPRSLHVCILGMGPSLTEYLNIVKRNGGRSSFCDEVWTINALGDVFDCDRVFHMDDVRIQQIRADANPAGNIAAMLNWLKHHPGPIYTSRKHPAYKGLVEFPLEDVINTLGDAYFNSTAAYAVAYAIYMGATRISVFGNDFTYENAHHAEKGRACVEFWLGSARARGIKVSLPKVTSLMDACCAQGDRIYGYDTLDLTLKVKRGKMRVSFKEKTKLPTAAEIEHRYDHNRHPSPLLDPERK